MAQKKKIYYARTYRRLRTDVAKMVLYFCLIVLPVLLIFVFNITNITELLSWLAVKLLGEEFPGVPVQIIESEFSILGTINVVEPAKYISGHEYGVSQFVNCGYFAFVLFFGEKKRKTGFHFFDNWSCSTSD